MTQTSRYIGRARVPVQRRSRARGRGVVAVLAGVALSLGAAWAAQAHQSAGQSAPPTFTKQAGKAATHCATGPAQREVEEYLTEHPEYGRVTVDGTQTDEDCTAIRAMQARFDVASPSGTADVLTRALVTRLRSARTDKCGSDGALRICVDLTTQTMWAARNGEIVLGPTAVRTGRPGEATPTGDFTITEKKENAVSTITGTPMHYWQHMRDGFGFHKAWTYLYDPKVPGSLGCMNMTAKDSADLFALTSMGSRVRIFGHKPGT